MPNIRMSRIDSEIQKAVGTIIDSKLEHPNLSGALVTVLNVDTTPDLLLSTISVSVLGGDSKRVIEALNTSKKFIRHELTKALRLKNIPELTFVEDSTYQYNKRMNELFNSIKGDTNV